MRIRSMNSFRSSWWSRRWTLLSEFVFVRNIPNRSETGRLPESMPLGCSIRFLIIGHNEFRDFIRITITSTPVSINTWPSQAQNISLVHSIFGMPSDFFLLFRMRLSEFLGSWIQVDEQGSESSVWRVKVDCNALYNLRLLENLLLSSLGLDVTSASELKSAASYSRVHVGPASGSEGHSLRETCVWPIVIIRNVLIVVLGVVRIQKTYLLVASMVFSNESFGSCIGAWGPLPL